MGTNYYAKTGKQITVTCDCGFEHLIDEELHIGKKSYGWKFTLHIIPEQGINELEDWRAILKTSQIYDEYGREISYDDMIKRIIGDCVDGDQAPYVLEHNNFYCTMFDPNDELRFVDRNKLGEEGSYCLMEGWFS